VSSELHYRDDLYRGTAPYYDRYRPPYPKALLEDLRRRLPVTGEGKLLDLACGTGQIAFPLAADFSEVWAIDQEQELVAFGRSAAEARGVRNIVWVATPAERVDLDGGFQLITIGNAFHRLNRQMIASRSWSWLLPGGRLALLWSDNPWRGDRPWQQAMSELVESWTNRTGATSRVPAGWRAQMDRDPHAQVLGRAGFDYLGRFEFPVVQTWTLATLVGFVYSTSFLNREVLGLHASAFEEEMEQVLRLHAPDGVFRERQTFAYDLVGKPV
jgi:SAM-dependent methyltransferase